jgi:hypothetical protein
MSTNPWLAPLKQQLGVEGEPTKPTEPGSVGFVAPKVGVPENSGAGQVASNDADQADAERWSWANSPAMNGGEVQVFATRVNRFTQRGLSLSAAEALAETLLLRDRDGDDRRTCLECTYLGERGHCLAAAAGRLPGAGGQLAPVRDIVRRCEGFGLKKGLT